jgi:CDP-paratose 2-epimerase
MPGKIIITGGCGFVGYNLAVHLSERGARVTVADNLVRKGSETNVANLRGRGIDFVHCDIRNLEDFRDLPTDADVLIECSAQPSVVSGYQNPVYDFTTNVVGVINCLEFCRQHSTGMIFLSSSRVFPAAKINAIPMIERDTRWDWDPDIPTESLPRGFNPVHGIGACFDMDGPTKTIYGASKAAADFFCQEYAEAFDMPILLNRCGVIAGRGQFGVMTQGWLTYWAISCEMERPITYFGYKGKQVRDILFVEDLCSLIVLQLDRINDYCGAVWNVGGGREGSLSLVEATAMAEEMVGKRMTIYRSDEVRKGDVVIYITDNRQITAELGWTPGVRPEEGLQSIVRWVKDNRGQLERAGL